MASYGLFSTVVICMVLCWASLCDVTESMFILGGRHRDSNVVDPLCDKVACRQMLINCVDAVSAEDTCCPSKRVCPTGPNCWHNSEKIRGQGMHKDIDYNTGCVTLCSCPPPWREVYDSETEAHCRQHCPTRRE